MGTNGQLFPLTDNTDEGGRRGSDPDFSLNKIANPEIGLRRKYKMEVYI